MIVIGIDPGVEGALATVNHLGVPMIYDLPTMDRGAAKGHVKRQVNAAALAELVREILHEQDKNAVEVMLETPIAFPGQHASSIGAAFHTVGLIEGVISTLRLRLHMVRPNDWKKALKLGSDKGQARMMATRLYPDAAKLLARVRDHNRAEALLIAHYGRQLYA